MSEEIESKTEESEEISIIPNRRRFFTRRNGIFAFGLVALLLVGLTILITVSYRNGVFDNYVKTEFVAKMGRMGMTFDAEVFRVTASPLQLELKNATFNDEITGEKIFFIKEAKIGLTVTNLFAWQFSRDIRVDSTEINGAEVFVNFDEDGKSNFSNLRFVEENTGINFIYSSLKVSLNDGLINFGDVQHKISAKAKNVLFRLDPENNTVGKDRYNFNFTSTDSNLIYDENPIEPIDVRAKGIADNDGAEISELKLTSPIAESVLSGKLTEWKDLKYDLNIESSADLTQTSNILPLGTALRGAANFSGKVTGEGGKYYIEGEIQSDALAADNIRLKGLNIAATVAGENSMYEANGKAVAELLTFEDFQINTLQLIGNVRGTGTDFKWFGELQAAAAKSPLGTITGLYITDAVAEYKEKQLAANLGNIKAQKFSSSDVAIQTLQTNNVRINSANGITTVSLPNVRANTVKLENVELNGVNAGGIKATSRGHKTDVRVNNLQANNLKTEDGSVKNLAANDVTVLSQNGSTNITAKNVQAKELNAGSTRVESLQASGVTTKTNGNVTEVYSENAKVAKIETDAAVLGSVNVAGVRLTIKQGRIEANSGNIDAGNVSLTKSTVNGGGNLENVKLSKPVFVLEPSGSYRASADMSLGGGILGSIKLGAARASVIAENDKVQLNNLSAQIMDGSINGNAVIALNNRNLSQINAEFSNLDISKLLALQGGQVIPVDGKTTGKADLTFTGTEIKTASGTLSADFVANAGTTERGLVPLNGKVGLTAKNGLFNVDFANLLTEKSDLRATGQFDLRGYNSNLQLSLNSSDAGEIERIVRVLNVSPELEAQFDKYQARIAGNLNFNGNITGNLTNPTIDGRTLIDSIILRGQDLGALSTDVLVSPEFIELRNGKLRESDGGNLAFNVNIPQTGTNNITVQATLNDINTRNIIAALPVEILPTQIQNLRAKTSGTINVSGIPNDLQGEANISSGKGTINGQPFDGFDIKAGFQGNSVNLENFTARFGDGFLNVKGTYATDSTAFNFDVEGKDIQLTRVLPFVPNSQNLPNLTGIVNLNAKAIGRTSDAATYDINFSGAGRNIVVNENALGEVTFNGKTENRVLNANLTANFQGQPQSIVASVNFADENLPFKAETTFNNSQLAPFIALVRPPDNVDISGTATGRVFLEGNLSTLGADGKRTFTTDNLSGAAQFSQFALQIGETPLIATEPISVKFNSKEVVVDNAKFSGGGSNIVVNGTKALTDDGINNLTVDGKVNLSVFNAISKNTFLAGLADVSVRLTGVNKTARLNGAAELQNASAATFIGAERISFDRIKGRIIFTTNQAQIDNLSAFLGGGKVTASGGALLDGLTLQGFRLDVRGTNFTAPLPPDFITTGDAEIEISGNRINGEMNTRIAGSIYAKRTIYNKDIDLADFISGRREGSLSANDNSSSTTSTFFGVPKLDIRLEGRDALIVRNNLADLTASISLRVTGDIEYPQVSGRVTANSGTIFFRKDRYEVQRGVLEFPPNTSIEPFINLQAETEISGYQVIVNLVGELANTESLNATVRSSPALPQADVISLITTGNLANTDTGIPTLAQTGINTAAEILTDELINNPLSRATNKLFGLNRFEIDPVISGQRLNPSARLTVGRQINRNLLITYSTNLSEDQNQILALEYRVSNRLSFIAQYEQRSLSNVTRRNNSFSFDVRLRKRF